MSEDIEAFRYFGGESLSRGRWLSRDKVADPINQLSLPPGNTAESIKTWIIPRGTGIIEGPAASMFGRSGGANQIFVPDASILR